MSVRVIITGCRNWRPTALVHATLTRLVARYGDDLLIIHGDATGVDATFADACESMEVRQERHPARWDDIDAPGAIVRRRRDGTSYAANAGPIRNEAMAKAGAAFCLAFHRDLANSRGTGGMVRLALAAGIATWHYASETAGPVRLGTHQGGES